MGYRSQVAGCISVDRISKVDEQGKSCSYYDKAKFTEMIGFIKLSEFYEFWSNSTDQDAFGWKDGAFILYGADWKWYPDYEDVQAWNKLWGNMQNIEGISGYFVRVGEERNDVEEMEFGDDPCYDYFQPFTALSFDGNDYLGKRETNEEEQAEQTQTDKDSQSCRDGYAQETK